MCKKLTNDNFIDISNKVHNNKFDYSLVNYKGSKKNVNIICLNHGVFTQRAFNHMNGQGCPRCAYDIASMNYTMNKEDFVNKSNKLHKNKYDYNLVKYNNNKTKVIIICPKHGDFIQSPNSHLSGKGCPKCYGFKKSTKDIINEFKLIHNDKFDYSLV